MIDKLKIEKWNGSVKGCCENNHDFIFVFDKYTMSREPWIQSVKWCKVCGCLEVHYVNDHKDSKIMHPYIRELFNDGYYVIDGNLIEERVKDN